MECEVVGINPHNHELWQDHEKSQRKWYAGSVGLIGNPTHNAPTPNAPTPNAPG